MSADNPNPEKYSIKYSGKVPKDYDVSMMQYTFDFIYLVFKRDTSIEKAIQGVANEYGLSEDYLNTYLIENKYLINKTKIKDFSQELKKYNTKSLKKILKKQGLKTSGKREQIERRIFNNNLLGSNYVLSSKSRIFYKNKKRRINIYNDYLMEYYYFDEFNDFYMDNYRKKLANIPIEYINLHISKSIKDKNHEKYIANNQVMANHFLIKEKYGRMLENVLMIFCMNLNPVWKLDELTGHVGVSLDTYDNLTFLEDKLSKNTIINTYYLIWDTFNFDKLIMSKYEGYRILKDILNLKDYNKINHDLDSRFYENEDLKIKTIIQKTLFDF